MSNKLMFLLLSNVFHSNVTATKRRNYVENIGDWLRVLREMPIPVVSGFSGLDKTLLGLDAGADEGTLGCPSYSSPHNHALMSLIVSGTDAVSVMRMLDQGSRGSTDLYFFPEFDVAALPEVVSLHEDRDLVVPMLSDPTSVLYSHCEVDLPRNAGALGSMPALQMDGATLVPMAGTGDILGAFFHWQRFPDDKEIERKLVQAIRTYANSGDGQVGIFFVDLEAPLVGSHHGLEIWQRFAALIVEYGLQEYFTTPEEACEVWRRQGQAWADTNREKPRIARNLGVKWTAYRPQLEYIQQLHGVKWWPAMPVATQSDVLSAMCARMQQPRWLPADDGRVNVNAYDPTLIVMGREAIEGRLDGLTWSDLPDDMSDQDRENGLWFVERVCDALRL